ITVANSISHNNTQYGIATLSSERDILIENCLSYNNNLGLQTRRSGITISTDNGVILRGNRLFDNQGVPTQAYGIDLEGASTNVQLVDNDLRGNVSGSLYFVGVLGKAGIRFRNNVGYNPVGIIANPYDNTGNFVGVGGTGGNVLTSTKVYTCWGT